MNIYNKFCYIIILFSFLSNCAHMRDKSNIPVVSLLPKETDVPGWEMIRSPVFLNKQKVGKNKLLKSKGVVQYAFCKFSSFSDKNQVFNVEIMKLNNNLDAFGVFSLKRAEESIDETINQDLFLTKSGLYGLKGEFYFSVVSNIYKNKKSDFMRFYEILDNNIVAFQRKIIFPEFLKLFIEKQEYSSLIYYKNGHKDIPGARELFVIKKERSQFFLKQKNDFDAINLYNGIMKSSKNFIVSKSDDIQLILNEKNNQFIFISMYKNYIFGILNAENILEGKKLIKEIYKNLRNNIKKK